MATLHSILKEYTLRLDRAGVDSPRLSAEILLAAALDAERSDFLKILVMQPERPLAQMELSRAEVLVSRRATGEPIAYITGKKEFYGREFTVTPATLIPRPDTETLIDEAVAFAAMHLPSSHLPRRFLDMGTGSGAIAVTLALELPQWQGLAVDISAEALSIAQHNARNLHTKTVDFLQKDFLALGFPQTPYGMVVANPPYVSEGEYQTLSHEITLFEPKNALVPAVPAADGLEHLRTILAQSQNILAPGGLLLMEMGYTQGEALCSYADPTLWHNIRIVNDMAGLPRVFSAIRS